MPVHDGHKETTGQVVCAQAEQIENCSPEEVNPEFRPHGERLRGVTAYTKGNIYCQSFDLCCEEILPWRQNQKPKSTQEANGRVRTETKQTDSTSITSNNQALRPTCKNVYTYIYMYKIFNEPFPVSQQ